ncbi:NaCP60E [Symbiodinium sp. CCMP2592]|nr:NaCP60E [Symbiodinium sp. CCMP2592]
MELEAVHLEETRKLRAEVAALCRLSAMQPFPRMSPPVQPISRENSRDPHASERCLVRESCTIVEKDEVYDEAAKVLERPAQDADQATADTAASNERRRYSQQSKESKPETTKFRKGFSASSIANSILSLASLHSNQAHLDLGDDSELAEVATRDVDSAFYERFGNVFMGNSFEMGIAVLLLFNIMLMAAQLQYHGFNIGYKIRYPSYVEPAHVYWPHVEDFFLVGDVLFAVIFTVEMLIRLFWIRCLAFFKHWLNWIDFVVVCSSWAELFAAALPISPTFLRMLRLGKLLRALRVVKMSQVLESLQLLLKCIAASVRILFWSLVLLMIIQCSAGMTISYMVSDFMVDPAVDEDKKFAVFRYYGTFSKTLLTMFEVLFANWAPACRVLMDNVSEWYSTVFIIYRCFVGFAVLNVVNAVFVQSTMKVAQADDEFLAAEKQRQQDAYRKRLTNLFKQVDSSGDGKIDIEEFGFLLENPKLQVWMGQLEIETTDLVGLFQMLDDGDGEISLEEFEAGIMRMKGYARSFDLNKIEREMQKMQTKVEQVKRDNQYYKAVNRELKKRLRSLLEQRWEGNAPSRTPRFMPTNEDRAQSKFLACRVCEERVTSLLAIFRSEIEKAYSVDEDWAEKLSEGMGSARQLCDMKDLSALLLGQRLDIDLHDDGSASLKKAVVTQELFYPEILHSEKFHYKSYMVQNACQKAFDDMDFIADAVARAYEGARRSGASDAQLLMMLNRAGRAACSQTRACADEVKLRKSMAGAKPPQKRPAHSAHSEL